MTTASAIRVAFVTNRLGAGGAANCLLRLGNGLRELGYDVEFVTTAAPGSWFPRAATLGLRAHHLPGHNITYPPLHALRVGRFLGRQHHHVLCFSTEVYGLAALNMLPDRMAAITMCRSDHVDAYRENLANAQAWNVAVAVSPKVAAMARACVPGRPVVEIPDGVEPVDRALLEARAPHASPLRVVYAGRLVQAEKNILLLPAIVAECRRRGLELSLTVVGDGPDRAALEATIAELGMQPWIALRGEQPTESVQEEMRRAHALLLPSYFEGLPGVVLEAQMNGCVPVAANLPGVTDAALLDGETGFLVRGGAADYAAALAILAGQPPRWNAMSRRASIWAAERFSVAHMVERYDHLIREVLAGRHPLPRRRRRWQPVNLASFTWRQLVPKSIRYWRHPVHHFIRQSRVASGVPS